MKVEIQQPDGETIVFINSLFKAPDTETLNSEVLISDALDVETSTSENSETSTSETSTSETSTSEIQSDSTENVSKTPRAAPIENNKGAGWFSGTSWG